MTASPIGDALIKTWLRTTRWGPGYFMSNVLAMVLFKPSIPDAEATEMLIKVLPLTTFHIADYEENRISK